jgi:Leucine-rich repeat (LRR) protein
LLLGGFSELSKLSKTLKVLDLGNNSIDLEINEFYNEILLPIKKLTKLEILSFDGNPVEEKIKFFKFFIINELPK